MSKFLHFGLILGALMCASSLSYAQNSAHPKFSLSGAYYPGMAGQQYKPDLKGVPPEVRKMMEQNEAMQMPDLVIEPSFEKVKYLKIDPPVLLNERIERLIHGIYVDVPPEYDHYGYEIRRYMAVVGNADVLRSPQNIRAQLQNIQNAQIVLKYWKKITNEEIKAIEAAIEEKNASSSTRSSFKYHRGIATAFLVEMNSWLVNNREALEYLLEIGPDAYKYKEGAFIMKDEKQMRKYKTLFDARDKALGLIQEYPPFRMMVY